MNDSAANSMTHEATKSNTDFRLPDELQSQLLSYRRRVWITKITEAIAVALCCLLIAWLVVFALDRLFDTPSWLRGGALALFVVGIAMIPLGMYRWVWRRRTLPQVTRLICGKLPGAGDRLLGVLDLVDDKEEQERSPVLCKAAIDQVATEARGWDLNRGLPASKNTTRWKQAAVCAGLLAVCGVLAPAAVRNAWVRMTSPWGDAPRYTFAALGDLQDTNVVAHGEPFSFSVPLTTESRWKPESATLTIGQQTPVTAELKDNAYTFEVPAQIATDDMRLRIGDARKSVSVEPTMRPELETVAADVTLPGYLQREGLVEQDVRGGAVSLVKGSQIRLAAAVNRKLNSAEINGEARKPKENTFDSNLSIVRENEEMNLAWKDHFNLAGKEPFKLSVTAADDIAPTISVTGMRRQMVVLVSEQVKFEIQSRDDFGVREVGMQWQGFQYDGKPSETKGSRVLSGGGPERATMNASGTFKADSLSITPQAIELRVYAKDFYPDREPALSQPFLLYVLSPDDHAIWLTEQLNKWHRRGLEVRDRELKLYAENERIRGLSEEELNNPKTRKQIERQAAAEKTNGRRLGNLTASGEEIIQQAMKNPEFGVGHLEKWAEMLQILKDISANRMPSVANLLKDAAEAPQVASKSPPKDPAPMAGQNLMPSGKGGEEEEGDEPETKKPAIPTIVDGESSEQKPDPNAVAGDPQKKKGGPAPLKLPVTTLMGKPKDGEACEADEAMDDAVEEQKDLLAEFDKVADELNKILANLEGSTLVKRLKAASRKQFKISGSIGDMIEATFGARTKKKDFKPLVKEESYAATDVSYIMDDMQAYFDRRPFARFKNVLEDMRETDVLGSLRRLGDDIPKETGVSLAQVEYWGDAMDRWAEDLVDPAKGGT